jgi:hypothetical protein
MPKFLAILAITFAVLTMEAVPAQKKAPNNEQERQTNQLPTTINETNNCIPAQQKDDTADSAPGWHKFVTWPGSWETWALIVTFAVITWQACLMRSHAKHLRSLAEHIALSERAQVLLHTKKTLLPVLIPIDAPPTQPGEHIFAHCLISLKNFGRTPAHVCACEFEMQIGQSEKSPPSVGFYEKTFRSSIYTIAPNEHWPIQATLLPDGFVNSATLKEIDEGTRFLWLCGVVRYRDVFREKGKIPETRVCMLYETRTNQPKPYWRVEGPSEYNRTT